MIFVNLFFFISDLIRELNDGGSLSSVEINMLIFQRIILIKLHVLNECMLRAKTCRAPIPI